MTAREDVRRTLYRVGHATDDIWLGGICTPVASDCAWQAKLSFKHACRRRPKGIRNADERHPVLFRHLSLHIHAAADTPFEDGTFRLVLTFDESYPNKPPVVKFISKMFHPNVYANGELCLDILQNRWSPTYDVAAILTSIQSLLHDPNPNRCGGPVVTLRATRG